MMHELTKLCMNFYSGQW